MLVSLHDAHQPLFGKDDPPSGDLPEPGVTTGHGTLTWGEPGTRRVRRNHFSSPPMPWQSRRHRSFGLTPKSPWTRWTQAARCAQPERDGFMRMARARLARNPWTGRGGLPCATLYGILLGLTREGLFAVLHRPRTRVTDPAPPGWLASYWSTSATPVAAGNTPVKLAICRDMKHTRDYLFQVRA